MPPRTAPNQPGFDPGGLSPGPRSAERRAGNYEWIVSIVRARPGTTRADLMIETGLSRSTVKTVVADLITDSLLAEEGTGEPDRTGSGRRPALLFPVLPHVAVAAVRLGHDHIEVALGDMLAQVVDRIAADLTPGTPPTRSLDLAVELFDQLLARRQPDSPDVDAVVAALPGPINHDTGAVGSPSVLTAWSGIDVRTELGQRLGRPVHVDNDANLAAWAERLTGVGRDLEDFLYLEISRGVGAGLVLRGGVYSGHAGYAGEIGHNQVDPMGPLCRCGQHGCVEVMVNSVEILRRLRQVNGAEADDPRGIADFRDEVSARVLREAGATLGSVVAVTCNVLNPQAVVVGGDLLGAHPAYHEGLAAAIERHTQPVVARGVRVISGSVASAPLVGALVRAGHVALGHEYEAESAGRHLPRSSENRLVYRGFLPA